MLVVLDGFILAARWGVLGVNGQSLITVSGCVCLVTYVVARLEGMSAYSLPGWLLLILTACQFFARIPIK